MRPHIIGALGMVGICPLRAGEDLAKQLANPVSSLISVPVQSNIDFGAGPGGWHALDDPYPPTGDTLGIGDDWNLISRTTLPVGHCWVLPSGSEPSILQQSDR